MEDESASILNDLLQSLPYVKEVKQADAFMPETAFPTVRQQKEAIQTEQTEPKGSLEEMFGLWKGRNISLDKIRDQQLGRKVR